MAPLDAAQDQTPRHSTLGETAISMPKAHQRIFAPRFRYKVLESFRDQPARKPIPVGSDRKTLARSDLAAFIGMNVRSLMGRHPDAELVSFCANDRPAITIAVHRTKDPWHRTPLTQLASQLKRVA